MKNYPRMVEGQAGKEVTQLMSEDGEGAGNDG